MATISKYRDKFKVSIRKKFHKPIYKTFSKYDDAKSWASDSERKLEKGFYEDLTEANKTSLADVLEKYGKEKVPEKKSLDTPLWFRGRLVNWSNYIFATILILTPLNNPESHADYKVVVRMTILLCVISRKF